LVTVVYVWPPLSRGRRAEVARRFADEILNAEAAASLLKLAQDLSDIAEDLENGAIEIRHPERTPQRRQAH
jgi:hypothetical protein